LIPELFPAWTRRPEAFATRFGVIADAAGSLDLNLWKQIRSHEPDVFDGRADGP
jgi:hypothetical protein